MHEADAEADDMEIWDFAKKHGYTIVIKDSDFHELVLLYGIPPKIIWIRCGNVTNQFIVQLILGKSKEIIEFFLMKILTVLKFIKRIDSKSV